MNVCILSAAASIQFEKRGWAYMFRLRGITALDVAQRRIRFHDTRRNQVVEAEKVLVVSETVKVPSAPGKGTEVLGDGVQERLGRGNAESNVGCIFPLRIVRSFHLHSSLTTNP